MELQFAVGNCVGHIKRTTLSDITIEGVFKSPLKSKKVSYVAAAPPDLRASYTGSALPFTSPEMALQGTPNHGNIQLDSKNGFKITLKMPNSYYAGHGSVLVPPTIYLTCEGDANTIPIKLNEPIPFRTLTYPNTRTSAMFYNVSLPVRSQEQILRDSAYPNTFQTPSTFWALKPPY